MKRTALFLALLCALAPALGVPAAAQAVTVQIGGRPIGLNPAPIEQNGRVFVPLRGVFEQLGATVVYASGQINATRGQTTVSLTIGSTSALVDGRQVYLDVAPFIVGSYTYVPLRFLAQSLGANVDYVSSSNLVAISMPHGGYPQPRPPQPPPPPRPPQPPPPLPMAGLTNVNPPAGATITNRFPVVSANFSRRVQASTVRINISGTGVTSQSGISQTGFSYKPASPLANGTYNVRVTGNAGDGSVFDRGWTFYVTGGPPPMHLTINSPGGNAAVGTSFVVRGNTIANGKVRVTAGAGQNGNGQFGGNAVAGPAGNFSITVNLSNMLMGQQVVYVRLTATDPVTGRTAQQTLQLRLSR